ncbi:MAG TPA: hypothetical protein PKA82_08900 [Pyrinomonadaceae bacterium]|nr:hypothetical protein [Pyrinomonadaceae bacterium]
MEYIILLIAMFLSTAVHTPEPSSNPPKAIACSFFGKDYALKMIRQEVKTINEDEGESETSKFSRCTFVAISDETAPKIHFKIEVSNRENDAKNAFESVRRSNNGHRGFEEWNSVGDEALVHQDGDKFQLVMIRKRTKTITIKVNPSHGISIDVTKAVGMALEKKL